MKNTNYIWIILIILALILIVPNFMKKESANFSIGTVVGLDNCNNLVRQNYINLGAKCVGNCVSYTQQMVSCIGPDPYWMNTKYISFGDYVETCDKLTGDGKRVYECIYGQIPSTCSGSSTQSCTVGTCAGTQTRTCNSGTWGSWGTCAKNDANCGTPTCNTPADTNCDNCVATSELISLINKWVSNTETTSNLITAINAWTSGTC